MIYCVQHLCGQHTYIYTWHTNKSAHTGSDDDKTHLVLRIYTYVFRLEPRDSASKGPASSGAPVPLSLSTSLSASRDFSDVDAYFARLVGTIILAVSKGSV